MFSAYTARKQGLRRQSKACLPRSKGAIARHSARSPHAVDHDNNDYAVFESGAVLMYLAEKAGKLYPQEFDKRHEVNQWLVYQNASMGPMQGQANHFVRYAPEKIEYGQKRYIAETKRVYGVLDGRLKDNEWLAAGEYTIAGAPCGCCGVPTDKHIRCTRAAAHPPVACTRAKHARAASRRRSCPHHSACS